MTDNARRMNVDPDIAQTAGLIGDRSRAAMLCALLGAGELSASELAFRSGCSPQAASAHLAKLVEGRLLCVETSGRQRLFRLASEEVAHVVETLGTISKPPRVVALSQSQRMERLRTARSCYDHLAGRLGVALADRLVDVRALELRGREFVLTTSGEAYFRDLGIDVDLARAGRRRFAGACLDWTERRPHVAGSLGASILAMMVQQRWLERDAHQRFLRITDRGKEQFASRFQIAA